MQKKTILLYAVLSAVASLYSQPHLSTQPHAEPVTAFSSSGDSFFTAGDDGFVVKWSEDGYGEHIQLSDIQIKMIAVHPNGNDIAIYETDGLSIYRISVWDWKNQKRKFAKRFSDSVLSLSYSAKGTYLLTGTASVDGMIFLSATTGNPVSKISETVGAVTLAMTNQTEKTAVLYSQTGTLNYFDLTTKKNKAALSCEPGLAQTTLFYKNLILAGTKNNALYFIGATTGELKASVPATAPVIISGTNDQYLYYIEQISQNKYELKRISGAKDNPDFTPESLSVFSLNGSHAVSSALMHNGTVYIGSKEGDLFPFIASDFSRTANAPEEKLLDTITQPMYESILDIAASNEKSAYYFVTQNGIYETLYSDSAVHELMGNTGYENLLVGDSGLILWKKNSTVPVVRYSFDTNATEELYTPAKSLQMLHVSGKYLVCIENNAAAILFNTETKEKKTIFSGTGIQDAYLFSEKELFVAKTAATNPKSSLLKIDTETGETVPLKTPGSITCFLTANQFSSTSPLYGMGINLSGEKRSTEVFYIANKTNQYVPLVKWDDEDLSSFISFADSTLYTNIGKSNIRAVNLQTRKQTVLKRSSSLPAKLISGGGNVLVLNKDGSVSWFNAKTNSKTADWYLTVSGEWLEF